MKKFITILTVVALAAISCQQEQQPYTPGEPDLSDCYDVYFPVQEAAGSHTYDPNKSPVATFTAVRSNAEGAITVPVEVSASADGIFTVEDIYFEDGQTETTFDVTFPNAELGTTYNLHIEVSDPQYASLYKSHTPYLDFSVLRVEWQYILNPKTGEPAIFTFTQEYWGETAFCKIKYYEVGGIRTCHTETELIHIYNEPYEGYGFFGNATAETAEENELYFNMYVNERNSDGNMFVELIPLPLYYHTSYEAMIYMFDYYYYWTTYQDSLDNHQGALEGLSWLDFAKKYPNYPVGYYDGNGGLYFYIRTRGMYGIGGWSMESWDLIGIGEGFTRVDYDMQAQADYTADGTTPVYLETGKDIVSVKYAVFEGELEAAEIGKMEDGIKDGSIASESFSDFVYDEEEAKNFATLNVHAETTGMYTLVIVGYDEAGAAQNSVSTTFKFIAAGDQDEYAVDIKVGAESVPARYGDYDESNSFAFYVVGSDIVNAAIAYFPTSEYEKDVDGNNAAVKAGDPVSAETLAQINKAGGYYGVIDGLKALTSYTVVVWATNGDTDTFATAEWTTSGLPNEFISIGTYTYDAWWEGADPEQELYLNPNFKDTYVLPNWGGGVDFTFEMDEDGQIHIPTFYIGANHSSYGAVYYVDPFDYYSEAGMAADETRAVHSYYDAETNTYNFHFVLAVSAGSFGHFWETYTPAEGTETGSVIAHAIAKALSSAQLQSGKDSKFRVPEKWISVSRDPQPAKATVSVSYERRNKVAKDDSAKPTRESRKLAF